METEEDGLKEMGVDEGLDEEQLKQLKEMEEDVEIFFGVFDD